MCRAQFYLYHIQGVFFNWSPPKNVSRLAPPKNASTGPPLNLVRMRITLRSSDTQIFYDHRGGPVWDWSGNRLLTGQHLANSRGGQLKKTPLYGNVYFRLSHVDHRSDTVEKKSKIHMIPSFWGSSRAGSRFPSIAAFPLWSKMPSRVDRRRCTCGKNDNTTHLNSLRGSQERLQQFFFVLTLCLPQPRTPRNRSPRVSRCRENLIFSWPRLERC